MKMNINENEWKNKMNMDTSVDLDMVTDMDTDICKHGDIAVAQ